MTSVVILDYGSGNLRSAERALRRVGADVEALGVLPTPAVAYLVTKYKADAGVVISASHNPMEFNGIKVFASTAATMDIAEPRERRTKRLDNEGRVLRVRVYPSEFGKSRMEKEDVEGPPKEIFADPRRKGSSSILLSHGRPTVESDDDLDIDAINEKTIYHQEDAEEYDQEALRKYQLERLR